LVQLKEQELQIKAQAEQADAQNDQAKQLGIAGQAKDLDAQNQRLRAGSVPTEAGITKRAEQTDFQSGDVFSLHGTEMRVEREMLKQRGSLWSSKGFRLAWGRNDSRNFGRYSPVQKRRRRNKICYRHG
jgi:hypothetical protein